MSATADQSIPVARGVLVERVPCRSDPTQTYTLYLPSGYSADRTWPLLFVFDPRGRGTFAAEVFRDAAERYGWIIASSNNTMSDGDWEPNRRAVAAMWPDVRAAYAVDQRRLYAAGFSGGASLAWVMAANGAPLAGIIAAGGPDLPDTPVPKAPLAWFGAVGRSDFNYLDASTTARRFERAGLRVRLEHFDGPHRWLPVELAGRALGWFEALAIARALRAPDTRLLSTLADEELVHAGHLERAGFVTEACRVLEAVARDYPGTAAAATAVARVSDLQADPAFRRKVREERSQDDRERRRLDRIVRVLQHFPLADSLLTAQLAQELELSDLQTQAAGTGYPAASAQRSLETIFVQTSFYIWRDLQARRQWFRAAVALEIAVLIHADRPRLWVDLGAARAMQGHKRQALEALERAARLGFTNAAALRADARFEALRTNVRFEELLAQMTR